MRALVAIRRAGIQCAALLLACWDALDAQQKVDIRRSATPTVAVRIAGGFSNLTIVGWQHDSVALTGAVGAGTRLDGGSLSPRGAASGMKFFVEVPDGASTAPNRLELRVPRGARVWAKGGSAEIAATGLSGGLDLNVIGGSVRVEGTLRELQVESMDGAVSFRGRVDFGRLKTATGDIVFDGGGEDVSLGTVSGGIRVSPAETELQRGRFESVTGPITYRGSLYRAGDLRLDTHSGAIELHMPRRASLEVDAMTVTGTIENGWSSSRPIAGREGRGMELGFSSGTGGALVSIRSFKGSIRIVPLP